MKKTEQEIISEAIEDLLLSEAKLHLTQGSKDNETRVQTSPDSETLIGSLFKHYPKMDPGVLPHKSQAQYEAHHYDGRDLYSIGSFPTKFEALNALKNHHKKHKYSREVPLQ